MGSAVPPHTPSLQLSSPVQGSPSSHGAAFAFGGLTQPREGSQVGASWHWSTGSPVQVIGVPTHVPPSQWSPVVHWLPSKHDAPSGRRLGTQLEVAGSRQRMLHPSTAPQDVQSSQASPRPSPSRSAWSGLETSG